MDQANGLRVWASGQRKRPLPRVVAITSGKGGVGKTHLTSNIAVCAAQMGRRVLIIDADVGLANVGIVLGLRPRLHLGHLLEEGRPLAEVLTRGPSGIDILCGGSNATTLGVMDDAKKLRLSEALDSVEDTYDFVLIDSSAGIGENVCFFAAGAQRTVLVATPEPTSLSDAYATVKTLSERAGVTHFEIVASCVSSSTQALAVYERLSSLTSRFLEARLQFAGSVPTDENLHRAVMVQRAVCELYPQSPASRAYQAITNTLLSRPPVTELGGGIKFLWNRLIRGNVPAEG